MSEETASPTQNDSVVVRWMGWLLFVAAMLAGAWLRWRVYSPAVSSDELALSIPLADRGIRYFSNPEWARNPPLIPFLLSFLPSAVAIKHAGRALMAVAGWSAVIPAFFAGRRAARGNGIAGGLAALLVTLNPALVQEGLTWRLYGVWSLVETWRLACLCHIADSPDPRARGRTWKTFVVLTILLPWTHYSSIGFLAAEAALILFLLPKLRFLLRAHLYAAISLIPAFALILAFRNSPEPVGDALERATDAWLGGWWREFGPLANAQLAASLALGVIASLLLRDRPGFRALAVHALSMLMLWPIARLVLVRPAIDALGAPTFGLLFPALALALPGAPGRWRPITLLFAAALCLRLWAPLTMYPWRLFQPLLLAGVIVSIFVWRGSRATPWVALGASVAMWFSVVHAPWKPLPQRTYGVGPGDPDIAAFANEYRGTTAIEWHVFPDWTSETLHFDFNEAGVPVARCGSEQPRNGACFMVGLARFMNIPDLQHAPRGSLLVFSCHDEPPGCRLLGGRPCARMYECP